MRQLAQIKVSGLGILPGSYLAEATHLSSNKYLSDSLKLLTGNTTQQLIHERLIGHVKEKLSATELSVSGVAYALSFEYLQSFSKLFKTKTQQTPYYK